jgi:tripartite-type tricarboxylate transporter receptor subunit TctC
MFRQGRIHVDRRHFVAGTAAAAAALTIRPAFAEDAYPSHAITIINPFPPGGASDVVTRPWLPCSSRSSSSRW